MSDIKQAIIFAAGFGSRLQPITNNLPKVLVKVDGKEILGHIIERLVNSGFKKIIINTHYFSEQIETYIKKHNFNCEIILIHENEILETGGALLNARNLFDEGNILIYNGDILSDIDIDELWEEHKLNNSLATLCSFERESSRHFIWNDKNELSGWKNLITGEEIISRKSDNLETEAFAAIHVIKKELIDLFQSEGKFSLTPEYIRLSENNIFKRFHSKNNYWFDIGSIEKLEKANNYFRK